MIRTLAAVPAQFLAAVSAPATPAPLPARRPIPLAHPLVLAAGFLFASLLTRVALYGDPLIHQDEQFYLLVGERMLHGAIPYVDIWDRKPVGLFVLFAGIRLLGGMLGDGGVLAYQLVATLTAGLTAFVIERLARRIASPTGAVLAGLAYLLYLPIFQCAGGQTPVFYNLPVAAAVLVTLHAVERRGHAGLLWRGLVAMALIGLSLQLKPTVVFEGGGLGLALLWRARADGLAPARIAAMGLAWVLVALAPTLVAYAVYAHIGQADAFIDANVWSIFRRHDDLGPALIRLVEETAALTGFWCAIHHGLRRAEVQGTTPGARRFLTWWAGCAIVGFLAFGAYFDHYIAPVLVPIAVLAAPALGRGPGRGQWITRLLLGFGAAGSVIAMTWNYHKMGSAAELDAMTSTVRANLDTPGGSGCAYFYEGDPALYRTTQTCLATRWIFQTHLVNATEADAIGTDTGTEIRRILATHPSVVTILVKAMTKHPNMATRPVVEQALARDYKLVGLMPLGWRTYRIYRYTGG